MNDIIEPLTPDGNIGFDEHKQLWHWTESLGNRTGRIIKDVRGLTCLICGAAWNIAQMPDQYFDHKIDNWVHRSCATRLVAYSQRAAIIAAIGRTAPTAAYAISTVPNRYGGGWDTPWYEVRLKGFRPFHVELGFRKRVWSVTANHVNLPHLKKMVEAFSVEDSTKYETDDSYCIHAWNDELMAKHFTTMISIITGKIVA